MDAIGASREEAETAAREMILRGAVRAKWNLACESFARMMRADYQDALGLLLVQRFAEEPTLLINTMPEESTNDGQ